MLTGAEIKRLHDIGQIEITDFDERRLNPNSYNLRLGNKLKIYKLQCYRGHKIEKDLNLDLHDAIPYIDPTKKNPTITIDIPDEGIVLEPGVFYLGTTMERTWAHCLIPRIDGRSSFARYSLEVHRTAGFGDSGFNGTWTLEIQALIPILIKPGMEICQISFEPADGDASIQYNGKYQNQSGIIESRSYLDNTKYDK